MSEWEGLDNPAREFVRKIQGPGDRVRFDPAVMEEWLQKIREADLEALKYCTDTEGMSFSIGGVSMSRLAREANGY